VAPDGTPAGSAVYKGISYYYYPSRLNKLIETDEIQFDANGLKPVTTTTSYVYGNLEHQLVTQKTMLTSSGDNFISVYKYPSDFSSQQPYTDMYTRHIWGPVVEQLNYKNSLFNFLNSVKTDYAAWGTVIAPNVVSSKTGINAYEPRLHYYTYDNQGNEVETGKDLGPRTCYIWSYAGRYPIAKVENAVYSDIVSALGGVTAVENFKNNILPTDAQVKSFLTPLMASSTYQVSTFTCNPILGITSSTDAKGLVTYYEYDSFQRLLNIKDKDGNIIKHMDYHYANN
jgi:YD repeat-containing protein